jgi:putative SOS response-associated peptidase YedK
MCGRYTLSSGGEELALLFDLSEIPFVSPRYNMAPTQEAAVVRVERPGEPRRLGMLRWGLIPYWAKEASIGNRMINARSESVAEKPAYRWSFRKQRCLIPADGFYEWKKEGKAKQPYFIHRKDGKPLAFAGLWARWQNPEKGPTDTFTILTTGSNELIRPLHDRMPVILDPKDFDLWLDPEVEDREKLEPLLAPFDSGQMETFPVSRSVNSPAYDAADCIAPLVEPGQG